MAIRKRWYQEWSREKIEEEAPEKPGIYELGASWADNDHDILYIGSTWREKGLRRTLIDHLTKKNMAGVQKFRYRLAENARAGVVNLSQNFWESTDRFTTRLKVAHLKSFEEEYGEIPHFNDKIPAV